MEQAEPHLKVTDRRHFTADGELKDGAATEMVPPATPDVGPATAVAAPEPPAPQVPPVSLASFIVSLATQAAELIGGETKDLAGARQVISAIEMLHEKTEGNRTDEETRLIQAVLFDLRLAFVGASRGTAP